MENKTTAITVQVTVERSVSRVWKCWNTAADIIQWNQPSADWHTLHVEIDLKVGGRFLFRMKSKNSNDGFDFGGRYDKIVTNELIEYTLDDGRKTVNKFIDNVDGTTTILETFDPEPVTPLEIQKEFCQSVIQNFKIYIEKTPV